MHLAYHCITWLYCLMMKPNVAFLWASTNPKVIISVFHQTSMYINGIVIPNKSCDRHELPVVIHSPLDRGQFLATFRSRAYLAVNQNAQITAGGRARGKFPEGHKWASPSALENTRLSKKVCDRLPESPAKTTQPMPSLFEHLCATMGTRK